MEGRNLVPLRCNSPQGTNRLGCVMVHEGITPNRAMTLTPTITLTSTLTFTPAPASDTATAPDCYSFPITPIKRIQQTQTQGQHNTTQHNTTQRWHAGFWRGREGTPIPVAEAEPVDAQAGATADGAWKPSAVHRAPNSIPGLARGPRIPICPCTQQHPLH